MKKHKKKSMGKKMGGKGRMHTGPAVHSDMTSYMDGHGSRDPHAHESYHAANAERGMEAGMSPAGHDIAQEGGEGMSDNCEYC